MHNFIGPKTIRLRGSVSLFFALLMPALCLVLLVGLAYAERCATEYDGIRCLKSSGELALASYSRPLWLHYGLWAVNPQEVDLAEAEAILAQLPDLVDNQLDIRYDAELYTGNQLQDQVNRYMKLRAPVLMGADLVEKMRTAALSRQDLGQSRALATIQQGHGQVKAYDLYQDGQNNLGKIKGYLPAEAEMEREEDINTATEELPPDQLDGLTEADMEAGLSYIAPMLRHFSHYMLPVYEAMGTSEVSADTAFAPSMIEKLAGQLDQLLDQGLGVTTEAMNLAEYSQIFFPAAVNYERQLGAKTYLYTPQGESLEELASKRPLELEQIASGLEKPKLANKYCEAMITGMRFIPQYIAGQRSPSRQLRYESWANFLSASLNILSLGELQIDPQVLKYFLQAADSLHLARADYKALRDGFGLPFWPVEAMSTYTSAQYTVKFYYRDYMRLLMYTKPDDQLAKALTRLIKKQEPGPFYTKLQLSLMIHNQQVQYDFAYLDD